MYRCLKIIWKPVSAQQLLHLYPAALLESSAASFAAELPGKTAAGIQIQFEHQIQL